MITLLLTILLILEIIVSIFIIVKLYGLKCYVSTLNSKINSIDIKKILNNTHTSVSKINENINKLIYMKKIRKKEENIKLIINTIIPIITFLRNKNKKS